jgi:F-type H+-transporting ATPase subunit a
LRKIIRVLLAAIVLLNGSILFASANEEKSNQHSGEEMLDVSHDEVHHEVESFDAPKFIFNHIADSYGWHVLNWKDHHVSIPLPVILYSKEQGLKIFSSAKFHHGHDPYSHFRIVKDGPGKGKIIETLPNGEEVKPIDISITKNIAAMFFSIFLLLWIFLKSAKMYKKNPNSAPKGIQSVVEPIILFIRDNVAKPSIGHNYEKFMPYLLTIFFFIWINNMLGLVPIPPGGANFTGNLAVTMTLALFTFFITAFSGNKNYWKHIFNPPGVPWWMKYPPVPLMPIIEFFGMLVKPMVLMIRLFANISAGHIIVLGFLSLIFIFGEISAAYGYGISLFTVLFLIFMNILELLVAFIQAYVFTLLSALYFGMAVEEHH